jgi:hypothetical protein
MVSNENNDKTQQYEVMIVILKWTLNLKKQGLPYKWLDFLFYSHMGIYYLWWQYNF